MSLVVIGLSIGMLLFLLSVGLTLIFGMLGVINFAHGALYMLGAYLAYQTVQWTGSFWIALVVAPLIVAITAAAMEMIAIRRVYARDHFYQVLLTFGLILVIDELVRSIWGLQAKLLSAPPGLGSSIALLGSDVSAYRLFLIAFGIAVSLAFFLVLERSKVGMIVRSIWGLQAKLLSAPPGLGSSIALLGSDVSAYRLFLIAFGIAVSLAFFLVLERSKVGMIVRGCNHDSEMASCLGINVARVRTWIFAIGSGMAALGGVAAGPLYPVDTNMGFAVIIDCFMVVVIGGMGNIRGSLAGALLIGMIRAVGQRYVPELIGVLTYLLFIGVLLATPQGLFSRRMRQA